jgi:hypothetical protein
MKLRAAAAPSRSECGPSSLTKHVSLDLTHDEARAEAAGLKQRKQRGIVITTSDAARRMVTANAGVGVATPPDVKF